MSMSPTPDFQLRHDALGRLLLIDRLDMQWRSSRFNRDPSCAVCGKPG